jgi:hypothetical protein
LGVSFLGEQRVWQLLDEGFDLVSPPQVMGKGLLWALGFGGEPRRVIKASAGDSGQAGKDRTSLMGITTDGHHVIEREVLHRFQGFGCWVDISTPASAMTSTANGSSFFGCVPAEEAVKLSAAE